MKTIAIDKARPNQLSMAGTRLLVERGPDRGRSHKIERQEIMVGTDESADFVLADPTISRCHFSLRVVEEGYLVTDLESTNGTLLQARRIRSAYAQLGDRLELGASRLKIDRARGQVDLQLSAGHSFGGLRGRSIAARRLFAELEKLAGEDVTVLLIGETGTGKDRAAEALHEKSARAHKPLVTVDCSCIVAGTAESELFGHEKGAFTGAVAQRIGAFEEADGGTLFLDEIGELPRDLQAKLLGALERRTIRRVGGNAPIAVDVRVIAATNRDLRVEVNNNRFRADLFFRLSSFIVRVPPLRERPDDIPLLAEIFRRELTGDVDGALPEAVVATLVAHSWPGNVRELRNAVERLVLTGEVEGGLPPAPEETFRKAKESAIAAFEQRFLVDLLRRASGNRAEAARLAGMDRMYLHKLLRRHGIGKAREP